MKLSNLDKKELRFKINELTQNFKKRLITKSEYKKLLIELYHSYGLNYNPILNFNPAIHPEMFGLDPATHLPMGSPGSSQMPFTGVGPTGFGFSVKSFSKLKAKIIQDQLNNYFFSQFQLDTSKPLDLSNDGDNEKYDPDSTALPQDYSNDPKLVDKAEPIPEGYIEYFNPDARIIPGKRYIIKGEPKTSTSANTAAFRDLKELAPRRSRLM